MTAALSFESLDHDQLVTLVREALMAGHLIDRAGMPLVIEHGGVEPMTDIAIEEWMGASPIYTRRTQELLGFAGGTDVATMFKGMQLDIGAPPQFMDFRYTVHDDRHGEFSLHHCGALMDVEPMGEEFVHAMCHAIEDPTFPATACATNPRAKVLPVHRPPRVPADRHPHCHWTVEIDDAHEAATEAAITARVAATEAARLPITPIVEGPDAPGRRDYIGPLVDEVPLGEFTDATLRAIVEEVALQGQLLAISFLFTVEARWGREVAASIARRGLMGVGSVTATRLRQAYDLGDDAASLATVLELHPLLRPRAYVDASIEVVDDAIEVRLGDCPAFAEREALCWPVLVDAEVLAGVAWGANPAVLVDTLPGVTPERRFRLTIGPDARPEPDIVTLTRFSTGADFRFRD
jgi:hypothetical protein